MGVIRLSQRKNLRELLRIYGILQRLDIIVQIVIGVARMTDMRTLSQSNKGFFNFAGLQIDDIVRLKELSTCDRCRQPANVYVLIPALQMWVCKKCRSKMHLWGPSILKHLIGHAAGVKV